MALAPLFEEFLRHIASRLDPIESGVRVKTGAPASSCAAVTLFLRPDGSGDSAEVLFIKRAQRLGDPWSGHLALPGGRAEAGDATFLDAAIREAVEEVEIDVRDGGRPIGWLPPFKPLSARIPSITVMPLVALAPEGAIPHPQPEEVETAFWMSLDALRDGGTSGHVRREIEGTAREFPAYPSPHGPIWGITERIVSGFIALISTPTS
jgi:8-oxo-dGTP pyrophosphatase MutT (NUDIX family)